MSVATEFAALLGGRVLQGVGAALTWSCAPALATSLYPESERTRVLGFYSAAIAIGSALGPLAGGLLVERFGWPVVFWARLPLVGLAMSLAWLIPVDSPRGGGRAIDWTGALLLVGWLTAFLLAAARPDIPHGQEIAIGLVIAGCVMFALFLVHETRHPEPIIRPQLFRDLAFLVLNVASILVNLAGFAVMLLVPYHLATTAGLGAGLGGLVLASNASGVVVGSWLAGRLTERFGTVGIALAGGALSVAGLGLVGLWGLATPSTTMAATLVLQGVGLGLFQVAYADRVLATLPQADRGVAGSLTLVTRTIGIVGAAAGLSALSRHFVEASLPTHGADAVLAGFQSTFLMVSAGLAGGLAAVVVGMLLYRIAGVRAP
jgi:MFS family permease